MGKSRVEYENLIRNSILFSLDRNTQATAYKREALKLVEYLYLYWYQSMLINILSLVLK